MTDPLLTVRELSVRLEETLPVAGITFTVRQGEIVGIVGESGSGKSLTAKAITRLLPEGAVIEGSIQFDGIDLTHASEKTLRSIRGKRIGILFQDPSASLNPVLSVGFQIAENCKKADPSLSRKQALLLATELMETVGISDPGMRISHYPFQFSGGMQQRIMLAMVLAAKPDLLIADEPTTALDPVTAEEILSLLQATASRTKTAILFITHDLTIARKLCHTVMVMHQGKLIEKGKTEEIFRSPKHPFTKRLLTPFSFPVTRKKPDPSPLLILEGVKKTYKETGSVLQGINLTVFRGEILGLVGESGSGKSTLAKIITRLELPDVGQVRFTESTRPQMIFQNPGGSLNPKMRVRQLLQEPFILQKKSVSEDTLCSLLVQVNLDPSYLEVFPKELSGGQKQRIAIARALAAETKCIVCDEPTSALDRTNAKIILDLLLDLKEKHDLTLLFISHDRELLEAIGSRIVILREGIVIESEPSHRTNRSSSLLSSLIPDPIFSR